MLQAQPTVLYLQLQGIEPELHSFLVSHVGEEVYQDSTLLPLEHMSAVFLTSCTECAAYFAGIQDQVCLSNTSLNC